MRRWEIDYKLSIVYAWRPHFPNISIALHELKREKCFWLFAIKQSWRDLMNRGHVRPFKNCGKGILSTKSKSLFQKSSVLFVRLMDSNIPANPAYGVYISQLVRYARICTSKVDFMNRLRGLSLRLRQQGFLTNLLQRTFTKFFNRHGLIVVKYDATLREMRFAIQAWIAPSYPYIAYLFITWIIFSCISIRVRAQFYFVRVHYLFI